LPKPVGTSSASAATPNEPTRLNTAAPNAAVLNEIKDFMTTSSLEWQLPITYVLFGDRARIDAVANVITLLPNRM
jgi:hypothetical protein